MRRLSRNLAINSEARSTKDSRHPTSAVIGVLVAGSLAATALFGVRAQRERVAAQQADFAEHEQRAESISRSIERSRELAEAVSHGDSTSMFALLRARPPEARADAYLAAVADGQTELVKRLLDSGFVRAGDTRSEYATRADGSAVEMHVPLLDWSLQRICDYGYADMAAFLIGRGAHADGVSPDGWPYIADAACGGHTELVGRLLHCGTRADSLVRPHAPGSRSRALDGLSPLMLASAGGHADTVKLLLANGAAAARRTASGLTALWLCRHPRRMLLTHQAASVEVAPALAERLRRGAALRVSYPRTESLLRAAGARD